MVVSDPKEVVMADADTETVLVDKATKAFRIRLAEQIAARRTGTIRRIPDPDGLGEEAADFVTARLDAASRSPLAERIGPVYRTEALARWLRSAAAGPLTTEAVRKRAKARQLVAFRTDDGHWAFPAWQFDAVAGRLVPRQEVVALWRDLPHDSFLTDADLAAWMHTRQRSLDGTPVDHLLTHGRSRQLDAARARLFARVAV
jgi:predicted transcriptional regulator